jgi:hypothetical protein
MQNLTTQDEALQQKEAEEAALKIESGEADDDIVVEALEEI